MNPKIRDNYSGFNDLPGFSKYQGLLKEIAEARDISSAQVKKMAKDIFVRVVNVEHPLVLNITSDMHHNLFISETPKYPAYIPEIVIKYINAYSGASSYKLIQLLNGNLVFRQLFTQAIWSLIVETYTKHSSYGERIRFQITNSQTAAKRDKENLLPYLTAGDLSEDLYLQGSYPTGKIQIVPKTEVTVEDVTSGVVSELDASPAESIVPTPEPEIAITEESVNQNAVSKEKKKTKRKRAERFDVEKFETMINGFLNLLDPEGFDGKVAQSVRKSISRFLSNYTRDVGDIHLSISEEERENVNTSTSSGVPNHLPREIIEYLETIDNDITRRLAHNLRNDPDNRISKAFKYYFWRLALGVAASFDELDLDKVVVDIVPGNYSQGYITTGDIFPGRIQKDKPLGTRPKTTKEGTLPTVESITRQLVGSMEYGLIVGTKRGKEMLDMIIDMFTNEKDPFHLHISDTLRNNIVNHRIPYILPYGLEAYVLRRFNIRGRQLLPFIFIFWKVARILSPNKQYTTYLDADSETETMAHERVSLKISDHDNRLIGLETLRILAEEQ